MSYPVLSIQKRQAYYDEWLVSGEPQPQFLRRKNLGPSTFKTDGLKRGKPMIAQQPLQTLLPIQITPEVSSTKSANLCVQLSNGGSLYFTTDVSPQYMGCLLGSMSLRSPC